MKLFYREGRTLYLTEAGRTVYAWATDVLRRTHELSRHLDGLSDGTRGSVVLGASMSIGSYELPPVLSRFRQARPQVDIRLNISDSEGAITDTESGDDDFAIAVMHSDPSGPGLEAQRIGTDKLALVTAPDSDVPASPISKAQLADLAFVEAQQGSIRRRFSDAALRELGVRERNIAIEMGHPEAMKRAVMAGLGIAMLFRSAITAELEAGTLREVEVEGAQFDGPVYLVHRKDKLFSAAHLELLEEIRVHFALSERRLLPESVA